MNEEKDTYLKYVLKILMVLLLLVTIYFGFVYFIPVFFAISSKILGALFPFIVALIIAILIDPLVDWLVLRKGVKRGLAVAITLIIVLALIILLIVLVASRLVVELTDLYQRIPLFNQDLQGNVTAFIQLIRNYFSNNALPTEIQDTLRTTLQGGLNQIASSVSVISNWLINFILGLPGFITMIIIACMATFFISKDKEKISSFVYRQLPRKMIRPSSAIVGEVSKALVGFFRAEVILISITTLQTVLGLYILRVDYALTIGIIVGLLDLLPIIGPGALLIPWAIVVLLLGDVKLGVGILLLYGIITGVRQVIEPKILSQNIGLHPLATILSLYLGLQLLGAWGIIIGPFTVIVGKAIFKTLPR